MGNYNSEYKLGKISISINSVEVQLHDKNLEISFNKLEIGGTTWENTEYKDILPKPVYLASYYKKIAMLLDDELLENLEFSYGYDYFKNSTKNDNFKIYGGVSFTKI